MSTHRFNGLGYCEVHDHRCGNSDMVGMNTDTHTQAEPRVYTVTLVAVCTHCGGDVDRTVAPTPPFVPVGPWYHRETGREACEVTR